MNLLAQDSRDVQVEAGFLQRQVALIGMSCEGRNKNSCHLLSLTAAPSAQGAKNREMGIKEEPFF